MKPVKNRNPLDKSRQNPIGQYNQKLGYFVQVSWDTRDLSLQPNVFKELPITLCYSMNSNIAGLRGQEGGYQIYICFRN